ncbi:uncharacterized protein LOC131657409 [Vicia villosa]|uniref:uncharacterized protein LOC131599127 n=3 Tax=Vicia villosa TaxID=3911 RepID=UPI00273AF3FB|nr:uncharacterized protein LOC131599127 [Vicia villosa]XP_058740258.1 uncharacterized protein LOC131612482 [Vicia villosa]XP_058745563.1 uncharacterized protein LOC131618337 [Vicia villosa]XP_058760404.1 uncharacterized protein LOC131633733 [Vicia villosa]XP_058765678.1 uncharacterized protein LOC131639191 [Vicia villosa]XP_058765679.1 uncharacterized protein LOC131639191 [Vicia villosa]XP_058768769.1 uncharacterized protein LOC131642545 [Vicia villosa]XP_058782413.1 uncharacterized protein 
MRSFVPAIYDITVADPKSTPAPTMLRLLNRKPSVKMIKQKMIKNIGEGKVSESNNGDTVIDIPPDLLITEFEDPIVAIVNSTYPEFTSNSCFYIGGDVRDYFSANSIDKSEFHDVTLVDILTPEFLSSLQTSGLPNHHIKLKVGTPIMVMRNINQYEGLCNGTRLIITKLGGVI